ncbi:MAG: hypothetical protein IJU52_07310 [Clostridia bacterium]|nr:hypothetical protein [Clostridia bacterium]
MIEILPDRARFEAAVLTAHGHKKEGIGTQNEKILHAALKKYFLAPGGKEEVKVGAYYADVMNPDGIVEIQTGSAGKLTAKLRALLREHRVTVVLPVMRRKTLYWIDARSGDLSGGRRSPKTGSFTDLLPELGAFGEFYGNERFALLFFLYDGEEYKVTSKNGGKGYGARRVERNPTEALRVTAFDGSPGDFLALLPDLPDRFKAGDLVKKTSLRGIRLHAALGVLVSSGALLKEKEGRFVFYAKQKGGARRRPDTERQET